MSCCKHILGVNSGDSWPGLSYFYFFFITTHSIAPEGQSILKGSHFHESIKGSAMFSQSDLEGTFSDWDVSSACAFLQLSLKVWLRRKSSVQPAFFVAECYFVHIYTGNVEAAHLENLNWLKAWADRARGEAADSGSYNTQLIS